MIFIEKKWFKFVVFIIFSIRICRYIDIKDSRLVTIKNFFELQIKKMKLWFSWMLQWMPCWKSSSISFYFAFLFFCFLFNARLNTFSHTKWMKKHLSRYSDNKTFRIQKMNNDHVVSHGFDCYYGCCSMMVIYKSS